MYVLMSCFTFRVPDLPSFIWSDEFLANTSDHSKMAASSYQRMVHAWASLINIKANMTLSSRSLVSLYCKCLAKSRVLTSNLSVHNSIHVYCFVHHDVWEEDGATCVQDSTLP